MNIFVASRMKNVAERKAAIDVVHSLGHTPIFIEAQQMRAGAESKKLMDDMIDIAEAMIIILDEDHNLGYPDPNLSGRTPLVYEIEMFKRNSENWMDHIMVFARRSYGGQIDSEAFKNVSRLLGEGEVLVTGFSYYEEVATAVFDAIREKWGRGRPKPASELHFYITWSGTDQPGRLEATAGLLFTEFHLNVTHLSAMGVDHRANIILTASSTDEKAPSSQDVVDGLKEELGPGFDVRPIDSHGFSSSFYFELRVLDVPGVLNALCKVLIDAGVNIDDIRQRPASQEYDRQAVIMMWLSPTERDSELERTYLGLEDRLRNLVGVRSIRSRKLW